MELFVGKKPQKTIIKNLFSDINLKRQRTIHELKGLNEVPKSRDKHFALSKTLTKILLRLGLYFLQFEDISGGLWEIS